MAINREVIIPKGMEILYEKYHYCPGIKVGNTLYISGQVGRDENLQVVEGVEAQFVQTFENVKKVLTAAGATFDDVVEMITYHVTGTNLGNLQVPSANGSEQRFTIPHLSLFMQVKDRYFTNNFPTWTGFGITALSTPGLIVEIKCTAVLEN
ncbi:MULTISPECIES: RidA family protein [unclassified Tolypothrix]|uniref:RidA family protein n=1 Tax=unclassified Tolypothrix TaxID=2649714 RepID=UPI0005EAAE43|nr:MULTISPECIES: RidA family protein [unclassified Tolypothrix]BAY89135.1 endoribonuclease L-PSP [Microchaete diplosiphon NIES-3275]EKE96854.1 putative endoribonuclease L-PSP [Tolypothrix sp. PCC 7601]MBE9084471.1 RidA family protein [Tolypothrix sp. LEGE 11397]UYD23436.1 RidA family protein [Tolypothrix sp. PCC 7712]UYD34333.1 RidA family protein [Tolypothrix sp. PCC 7601]